MQASGSLNILVVANRTAATPGLLEEVRRRGQEGCSIDLLIPDLPDGEDGEATLALALPLLEEAAGRPVRGMARGPDPLQSVKATLSDGSYDEVIVSTLPQQKSQWLKRHLPNQIVKLGVPVTVVTAASQAGDPVARSTREVN
jgi:hypothetical protein